MRKIFISIIVASVFAVPAISGAQGSSTADIQAQITSLLAQIKQLQAQLKAQQGNSSSAAWCYSFDRNLRIGDSGEGVANLITVLNKEGLLPFRAETYGSGYDESIASAVVGFQEKYKSEILTPNRLEHGTGFVGVSTRKKLNQLYGCMVAEIVPLSATCSGTPHNTSLRGDKTADVTWTAYPVGGSDYKYQWSIYNDGVIPNGNLASVVATYTVAGAKEAVVRVSSGTQTVSASCKTVVSMTSNESTVQPYATITSGMRTTSLTPIISGTAGGVSQIGIVLNGSSGDKVYGSGLIPVISGTWSVTVYPALAPGQYTVTVNDANNVKLTEDYLFVISSTQISRKVSPCNSIGDVNQDGYVTEDDTAIMRQIILGSRTASTEETRRADVNASGSVNSTDVVIMDRFIAGTETTFPACTQPVPTGTVSGVIQSTFDDRAGKWGVFGPGIGLSYPYPGDWNIEVVLSLQSPKTIKSIGVYHTGAGSPPWKEGWSSATPDDYGRSSFPLVVLRDGTQLNTAYGQTLGTYVAGNQTLKVYAQVEAASWKGGEVIVNFTDGTQVKGVIPASSYTPPVPPTATLTIEGQDNYTYNVGQYDHWAWSSTGGDTFSSTYTANNPAQCGDGVWVANTANGSVSTYLGSQWAGCFWTVTYRVSNSVTGMSASDTATLTVNPLAMGAAPTGSTLSGFPESSLAAVGTVLDSVEDILHDLLDMLRH